MIYETIVSREYIDKGWSGDQKYRVITRDGGEYLLRVTSPERAPRFSLGFARMEQMEKLGIPMCRPIEQGDCPEGPYAIHSWVDGVDAEELIPTLSFGEQYKYGLDAGHVLQKIHSLPAPADAPEWEERFNAKIDRKIVMYENCELKYKNGEHFLRFISENRHLLAGRPQSLQHGDYHIGNMMVDSCGVLTVIDFDKDDYGDPWEEFNRIVWCAQAAPAFASGMVDGYFDGAVPMDFWKLLALYISSNTLSSLPWAIPFGSEEVATMYTQAAQVLAWYDNMQNVVPTWYQKGDTK